MRLVCPNDSNATTGFENTAVAYPDCGVVPNAVFSTSDVEAKAFKLTGTVDTTCPCSFRSVRVPVTADEFGFINCNCAPSFTTGKKALAIARDSKGADSFTPLPVTTAAASRSGLVL